MFFNDNEYFLLQKKSWHYYRAIEFGLATMLIASFYINK